jgi:hypothetical protein
MLGQAVENLMTHPAVAKIEVYELVYVYSRTGWIIASPKEPI